MMRTLLFFIALSSSFLAFSQTEPIEPVSSNGWYLSPRGTIRILVIYAEIDYDKSPKRDPQPNGSDKWAKGQLPKWKDDVFDPHQLRAQKTAVSKYYHDISMGQYTVLGDYINKIITIKESEHRSLHNLSKAAVTEANKLGKLVTRHGLSIADFDLWQDTRKQGYPKISGPDDPYRYDHVMVMVRNSSLKHGQGSTDPGSSGPLFGYECDSQSRFGAMNGMPFAILKHEYNHLLLGGNNFHSGGGNAARFESYLLCQQGGWSLMGAVNSSILSACGWDRQRLGWKPKGSEFLVRAWREDGTQCNGDLDPMKGDTGIFVIGDFVTTGDMIRIKLPHIPEDEYQQWVWLENHQGHQRNGSATDRYQWEFNGDCIEAFGAGIYAQLQIDRELRKGSSMYRGYADYLKALPANGNHDLRYTGQKLEKSCPFMSTTTVFERNSGDENPLSGFHEMELPIYDKNNNGGLQRSEHYVPYVRHVDGQFDAQGVFNGRPEHAFTKRGNKKIGLGTNPSTANTLTLVRSNTHERFKRNRPNNRVIYLNQISVEILDEASDGTIKVRVRANDPFVNEDVRWAADSIVLPANSTANTPSLVLAAKKSITIDRSITPTRNDEPEEYKGDTYYNSATKFTISAGAEVILENNSSLHLRKGSTLHLMPGAKLVLKEKARLTIDKDCTLVLHPGSKVILHEKSDVHCSGTVQDLGLELFQFCKGQLVTQGDKKAFGCK